MDIAEIDWEKEEEIEEVRREKRLSCLSGNDYDSFREKEDYWQCPD